MASDPIQELRQAIEWLHDTITQRDKQLAQAQQHEASLEERSAAQVRELAQVKLQRDDRQAKLTLALDECKRLQAENAQARTLLEYFAAGTVNTDELLFGPYLAERIEQTRAFFAAYPPNGEAERCAAPGES